MVKIVRVFDAEKINPILNHPLVLKWIAKPGTESLDAKGFLANKDNILLMDSKFHGGVLFEKLDSGLYEAHTNFFPGTDARLVVNTIREIIDWMFTHTDCIEIVSKVAVGNVPARKLAEHFLNLEFVRENVWELEDGSKDAMEYYSLRIGDWVRECKGLIEKGQEFHARLESQIGHPSHPEDLAHDRWVGMCVSMIEGGQATKGVVLYNRWAKFSGYEPIALMVLNPVVLNIKSAIVVVKPDGTFGSVDMESA